MGVIKYPKNEVFFDNWNPQMSYILGNLIADAYLNLRISQLEFGVHPQDADLLFYIRDCICPTAPIRFSETLCKTNNKIYQKARLIICSKRICETLRYKYGVLQPKTFREVFPKDIPSNCISHFVRGYFDGDGDVRLTKNGYLTCGVCCASKTFLDDMQQTISLGSIHKCAGIWYLYMSTVDAIKFKHLIYNDTEFALKRKRLVFASFNEESFINKFYTNEEEQIIKDTFDPNEIKSSVNKICILLNRSSRCITKKIQRLGLHDWYNRFTKEEELFITENIDKPSQFLADQLNRPITAIYSKVYRLRKGIA